MKSFYHNWVSQRVQGVSSAVAKNPPHSTHNFGGPLGRLTLHSQPRSWVLCGQTRKLRCSQEQLAKREERSGSKRRKSSSRKIRGVLYSQREILAQLLTDPTKGAPAGDPTPPIP